ncbi:MULTISPECIES: hypothetical protein [Pseudomonas]|uniref:Transmembrane protein n=1 Tax=Pseudomonas fluorescens TaxID=294 RepID=A0A5E6T7B7_PSEFL|nr:MULTISPECIES: hypothetical protein [Pseudomonas]VVM88800.1 hypothetical protein PS652_02672 [Pseudomonas fluorescens]
MIKWRPPRPQWRHLALLLYLLSLVLPAVYSEDHNWLHEVYSNDVNSGFHALILGLPAMLYGYPAWLANPFFLAAYRSRSGLRSLIYALLALLAGLSVQWQLITWQDEEGKFVVTGFTWGYYLWLMSFAWLGVCAVRRMTAPRLTPENSAASV